MRSVFFAIGIGLSSVALIQLRIVLFAQIPRASVTTAVTANPGDFRNCRNVYRTSAAIVLMALLSFPSDSTTNKRIGEAMRPGSLLSTPYSLLPTPCSLSFTHSSTPASAVFPPLSAPGPSLPAAPSTPAPPRPPQNSTDLPAPRRTESTAAAAPRRSCPRLQSAAPPPRSPILHSPPAAQSARA